MEKEISVVVCPYDKNHIIHVSRIQRHLAKCSKVINILSIQSTFMYYLLLEFTEFSTKLLGNLSIQRHSFDSRVRA